VNTLRNFYYLRAIVAFVWVALAAVSAAAPTPVVALLLFLYPAWDALANVIDAQRNGGLAVNAGQKFNAVTSTIAAVAIAVAFALYGNMGGVFIFGVWALLAGVFQLAVGIHRRKSGGQFFMILSGAQSALAGALFCNRALHDAPGIAQLAPYAAFGGIYFLLSALWLTFRESRQPRAA
jgi:uncharacterized membrane protein HdeD (DUF308 family)